MLRIDFSTIALILSLVVPGLIAKKSRRTICPQSFESTGPATELGSLVALSLSAHLILLFLSSLLALTCGILFGRAPSLYFRTIDRFDYSAWESSHRFEAVLIVACYVCLSLATGYLLGILSGWLQLNHPLARMVESSPLLAKRLKHLGIYAILEERPLSFDLFSGEQARRKTDLSYFLQIQLRGDKGFVTGELVEYAIVKDEELHRPVLLRDAYIKPSAGVDYEPIEGERILVDLADALLVQVTYRDGEQAVADVQM